MSEPMELHDLLSGLVRLDVLHPAGRRRDYGWWMINELAPHSYRLTPGTLYPMLSRMTRDGYLTCGTEPAGRTVHKYCKITAKGRDGLAAASVRMCELKGEDG